MGTWSESTDVGFDLLVGSSEAVRRVESQARRFTFTDRSLALVGPSGSGRRYLAQWLHDRGSRASRPFAVVRADQLASLLKAPPQQSAALFSEISQGTLLLQDYDPDRFGALHASSSDLRPVTLERLLRSVDVRLLVSFSQSAWNQLSEATPGLLGMVFESVPGALEVPPLSSRREDIAALSRGLLERLASTGLGTAQFAPRLEPAAEARLAEYEWPGGLRELELELELAYLRSDGETVFAENLALSPPVRLPSDPNSAVVRVGGEGAPVKRGADLTLRQVEILHIENALRRVDWHVETAAKRLGVPRSTLYQKIKRFGLRKAM